MCGRLGNLLSINGQNDFGLRAGDLGLEAGVDHDRVLARRDLFSRLCKGSIDDHQVVFKAKIPIVHKAAQASAAAPQGIEHTVCVLIEFGFDADNVAVLANWRGDHLRYPSGAGVEGPVGVGRPESVFRVYAQPVTCADGEGFVLLGFRQEQFFHLLEFLGLLQCQVSRLGEIPS